MSSDEPASAALSTLSLSSAPSTAAASAAASSSARPRSALPLPFRQTKSLGEDVVVLRHLSKKYILAASKGKGADQEHREEVVALRHVNLIPLGEEPEQDEAEERRSSGGSSGGGGAAGSSSIAPPMPAHGSHMHPIRRGEFVMIRGPSGGGKVSEHAQRD